ncbi:putative bifunctional diguanylate cyclase/phosphodiesterase [Sporosarcina gallistercoris]|uniref:Sensor domain-containing phosphodiesterase n=1 Tax=Sporosarcina gallistercoris TaxID=2762245 RepID=A0ABR8PLJ1_9BACL|nr:GGDEF and EAL domain-containing protein [Sporosarcina gallistercoris]MBD7909014.1 sensor domain-containing phosphodiesterase [Sporosarcina gallistercoris]
MERSKEELREFVSRMQEQQQNLFKQAKQLDLTPESMKDVLYELCENIAMIMKADRVSIWLFNDDQTILTEHLTYAAESVAIPSIRQLDATEAKLYFETIGKTRVNVVEDIAANEALESFPLNYFNETPIASLLEASIIMSRGIGGLLCCETIERRNWTKLDEVFIAASADMLSFVFDRLNRLEMESRVHELAYTDLVTGIDNENAFIEKVNEKIRKTESGLCGAFLYMKIDQFISIQSVLGPEGTKSSLKVIANRLRSLFPDGSDFARIAFDHFIIYSEYRDGQEKDESAMGHILSELRKPIMVKDQELFLTFSYGVSLYPKHVKDAYEGIHAAKIALDSSLRVGNRKTRAVYDPLMFEQWEEEMHSEMNLGKGLDMDEFRLFYQPQVESLTHKVTGVEALIRWQHPEKGLLFPAAFINIAETTGLIIQIGEWVVSQACQQLKSWEQMGMGALTISVNISPRHFLHADFPTFLDECMRNYEVDPKKLIIEITENVAIVDSDLVETQIKKVQEMGFPISIDDFGTGYSAFLYLQRFSIQEVKVDRQFVANLETDPKSRAIVRAILTLAKSLHMHTVAEGVETEGQLKRLEELGCFEIQGYYFSRPLPIEELNSQLLASPGFPFLYLPIRPA